jgi:glyoxylase-like metal-dependent hydrolase (beta-lactamase superfamily II)
MLVTWIETRCDAAFNDGGNDPADVPRRGPVPPAPLLPPAVRRIMSPAEPQAQPPSAGHSPYPGVVSPDAPHQGTASLRVLSTGYLGRRFASTVTFVRDGAAVIIVNPGMVADIESILGPLRDLGVRPAAVTDVVLLAARPAHVVNAALFPGARLHDATAVYQNDRKTRRPADGFLISPSVRLIETPGHHPDDLTMLVATPRGIVAVTHLWSSRSDGADWPPGGDPGTLRRAKTRVLGVASRIVPAHGAAFRAGPDTPV